MATGWKDRETGGMILSVTLRPLYALVSHDCERVGIPPLMSRKTLGILDGGRGGAVDRARRRRGITGVDKGGA